MAIDKKFLNWLSSYLNSLSKTCNTNYNIYIIYICNQIKHPYLHIDKSSQQERSLINLSAVSANLWNSWKCVQISKCFLQQWTDTNIFTILLFHSHQKHINLFYHINYFFCCPDNTQNCRTDRNIKHFKWYMAFQIRYTTDLKSKRISFIKHVSGKCPIIDFYWKIQKWGFKRIFIFILEFQITRINMVLIIFKLVFAEST